MNKLVHWFKMFTDEEYEKNFEAAKKLQEGIKNQEYLLSLKLPIEKQIPSCLGCRFCKTRKQYKHEIEQGITPRYKCERPLGTTKDYDYIKGIEITSLSLNYKECFEERTHFYDSSQCCGTNAIFFMKKEEGEVK